MILKLTIDETQELKTAFWVRLMLNYSGAWQRGWVAATPLRTWRCALGRLAWNVCSTALTSLRRGRWCYPSPSIGDC